MTTDKEKHQVDQKFVIFNGGDLSIDYHIQVKNELRKELKYVTNSNGIAFLQIGNAFFTGKLLETAFAEDKEKPEVEICELYEPPTESNIIGLPSTFSIIRKFHEKDSVTGREISPWRISEYLGRSDGSKKDLFLTFLENHPDNQPNILILSEYSHNFRNFEELWPTCIRNIYLPPTFLRCSNPLLCEESKNKLLYYLLKKRNAESNLVLCTTIDDLRQSDIYIKHGLSWESTALDLVKAFNSSKFAHLRRAAYVIVIIGRYGAFLYQNEVKVGKKKYSLFYSKNGIEENNDMEFTGSLHGLNTGLLVNVILSCINSLRKREEENISFKMIRDGLISGLEGISNAFTTGFILETDQIPSLDTLKFPADKLFQNISGKDTIGEYSDAKFNNFTFSDLPRHPSQETLQTWDILIKQGQFVKSTCYKIIKNGDIRKELGNIPYSSYGQHIVVGRKEIEESREIKKLITSYDQKRKPKKPLSIAVFGEPGSGKSHSIEKIASSVFETKETILKFNLSQITGKKSLLEAFHLIRDAAIEGKMVIAIWDEFDTFFDNEDFGWVKYFLGPMQDGIFYEGSIAHPLGQSIFFFLSSKYKSLEEITNIIENIKLKSSEKKFIKSNASIKLIDFISRLQGHIEIPGINQTDEKNKFSPELYLRRGIILRSLLKKHCPTIFDIENKASIDSGLISAFLEIEKYYHGTRSMEAIITMSHVDGKSRFSRSCLPPNNQLSLHVNEISFWNLINSSKELEE